MPQPTLPHVSCSDCRLRAAGLFLDVELGVALHHHDAGRTLFRGPMAELENNQILHVHAPFFTIHDAAALRRLRGRAKPLGLAHV